MPGKVNIEEIPEQTWQSPKGKYGVGRKPISTELGMKPGASVAEGGHPFDVEWVRLAPGMRNFPYHQHAAMTEFYIVVDGQGVVRSNGEEFAVSPGDCFVELPGSPHQIRNESATEDLVYYVIADNQPVDVIYYPDSDKMATRPPRKVFRFSEVDYFDGED